MRGLTAACLPLMIVHIFIMSIIPAGELRTAAIVGPETLFCNLLLIRGLR